jgi:APA family basic amino acid/polyamine antiporter
VDRGRLLRVLGVGFGLAVTLGGTIGMGILRTPGEVASHLPDTRLFLGVWIAGGIYALLGTVSVAELAAMIPRSGGFYVFAHRAFGAYAGFVVGWSDWLSTCGTTAAIAIVIAEYTIALKPSLADRGMILGFSSQLGITISYRVLIAVGVTVAFAVLQWRGVRWGSNAQNITSLLKAIAFLAFAAACLYFGSRAVALTSPPQLAPAGWSLPAAIVLAMQGVLYTYDGWYGVIYFGEEIRSSDRNIPRSMIGGVLIVIAIYLLVNVALLYVLPISKMAGEQLAVGTAAQIIFPAHGIAVIAGLAILTMLGTISADNLTAPRIMYAMSCDDLFIGHAVRVNRGGTPSTAMFISTAAAVLFILSGTFEKVLAVLAFFFVINYGVSFLALFMLRRREPDARRPYRAWGYPWTTGIVFVGSLAFLAGSIASDTRNSLAALLLLAISYPVYHLQKRLRRFV